MASKVHHLHFLLIPLLSQSHIIPLTDFGKLLAKRSVEVSIITTPLNAIRYRATIHHAIESGLRIQLIALEFPSQEAGLPTGCENMDLLTSMDLASDFFRACEMLKTPLENMILGLDPKPSCIISTNALPWTQQVADRFKIPRYIFETISCFTLFCSKKLSEAQIQDLESFLVPNIPHKIEFKRAQLPENMRKTPKDFEKVIDQIKKSQLSARGTLVNSFEKMEHWYVEGLKKERENVRCIGPVSLCNEKVGEKFDRGNKNSIDENYCISWLDWKEPKSVIYACFGSLCRVSPGQIKEIGLGLEASCFPFVWVIRGLDCSHEVEKWLFEEKFEERVEGRGLIVRGWAPQVLILSHQSVGGFLMHCGWNSTLEGVCAGVPMVTWPMFAEQFYNEKFIVNVLGIGVRIGAEGCVKFGGAEEQSQGLVKWDRVKRSIEEVMDGDEEGKERRRRVEKLAEMAKEALEGGSSYLNVTLLIQDVTQHVINNY
ncbi:UDP-glucuronosyl and UDP-glucosyl transferase [Handroanthus impetiginosus]|uniref:Glycosyltransferase n=1 Tax=Handroanthus impetiginosus TaxID=429701 RepID=A0A2G9HB46_9LAMI|nr:UDP-glucuronosyl and UDP-glucosyl transferase [Handroanthus impetiginosus]